jgi:hypothetical protein
VTPSPDDERPQATDDDEESVEVEVSGISAVVADRGAAEALSLEVRRLARSLGLELGQIRVERADDPDEPGREAPSA